MYDPSASPNEVSSSGDFSVAAPKESNSSKPNHGIRNGGNSANKKNESDDSSYGIQPNSSRRNPNTPNTPYLPMNNVNLQAPRNKTAQYEFDQPESARRLVTFSSARSMPRQQGQSIITFNPSLPPNFTESYTIKAIQLCGLAPSDLMYPDDSLLNTYSHDPNIKKIVRERLISLKDQLIKDVKEKREHLIKQSKEEELNKGENNDTFHLTGSLTTEDQRSYEAIQRRQKKEVEQLLLNVIIQKQKVEEQKKREQRELELRKQREEEAAKRAAEEMERAKIRKKELEGKEREKKMKELELKQIMWEKEQKHKEKLDEEAKMKAEQAKEEERMRKEKAQAAKQYLQSIEDKKKQEIEARLKEAEEREMRRQKAMTDEVTRIALQRDERNKKQEEIKMKVIKKKEDELKMKAEISIMKETKAEENIKHHEEEKQRKREAFRKKELEKILKFRQSKKSLDLEKELLNNRILKSMKEADKRYKALEHEKIVKMMEAQQGYSSNAKKIKEKVALIKQREEEKNMIVFQKMKESEQRVQETQEREAKARALKSIELRLHQEIRAQTAVRAMKRKEAELQILKDQFEEKIKQVELQQMAQKLEKAANEKKRRALENEKRALVEKLALLNKVSDNSDTKLMEHHANEFNIDLNSLYERSQSRRATLSGDGSTIGSATSGSQCN